MLLHDLSELACEYGTTVHCDLLQGLPRLPRFQRAVLLALVVIGITCFSMIFYSFRHGAKGLETRRKQEPDLDGGHVELNLQFKSEAGQIAPDVNVLNKSTSRLVDAPKMSLDDFTGPTNDRQRAVRDAFLHAWAGYRRYAWGKDQLKPVSKGHQEWFGLALTILDSLDTLAIMGLKDEFAEARAFVADLSMASKRSVNLFEVTIRCLAGLLSAYHLSGHDPLFKDKAIDLGERLTGAFKTASGIPLSDVNLATRRGTSPGWTQDSSLSEVTTLQLEFRDLSRVSGQSTFEALAFGVSQRVHDKGCRGRNGLCPIYVNPKTGEFRASTITFGARGDSYYEYLLKQWLQTGKSVDWLRSDYVKAMEGVSSELWRHSVPNNLGFLGEIQGANRFVAKMDHLVCFLAGALALGVESGASADPRHMQMAKELAYTCFTLYNSTATGLSPEIAYFNTDAASKNDIVIKPLDSHYLLRPETVESLFYLYRFTKDPKYQDMGWYIFQAIEKHTRVPHGYTTVSNVRRVPPPKRDLMESYFLAETLKYLYLLFDDDQTVFPLDQWVFNTEGHPLPIYKS